MILVGRRVGVGGLAIDVRVCACVWVGVGGFRWARKERMVSFLLAWRCFCFLGEDVCMCQRVLGRGLGSGSCFVRVGPPISIDHPTPTQNKHTQKQ